MAELTTQERLQPSLLDRLTDDEPGKRSESADQWAVSHIQLREMVLRDLARLLNAENIEAVHDLEDLPEVTTSVLNYGLPVLTGKTDSGLDLVEIERRMRAIIANYEPRIVPESLQVRSRHASGEMSNRQLQFELEGDIWSLPIPIRFLVKTELDLDGNITVLRGEGA